MPPPSVTPEPRYRIADIAGMTGVSVSTLRLWERQGLVAPPRSPGAHRLYGETELARIRDILRMRTVQGLNVAAIRATLGAANANGGASGLGPKLRALREGKRLSLRETARRTGLAPSFVSGLERGAVGASVSSLMKLALAYDTPVTSLVVAPSAGPQRVVRAGDGRRLPVLGDIEIEQVTEGEGSLEAQLWTIAPGTASEGAYSHPGEEFLHILSGRFEITLNGEGARKLGPGDTIYFPSTLAHSWRNPGAEPVRLLWVSTPRIF